MSKEISFSNEDLVTLESVKWYVSKKDIEPHKIDGIPEGFSYWRKRKRVVDDLIDMGELLGFTPGYKWNVLGAMFYKPIVVHRGDDGSELDKELKQQGNRMVDLYKENLKKLKNAKGN